MLFNSWEYLLFFPVVVIIYFGLPHKFRWIHLLLASCFFYSFFIPEYIFILFLVILIDYWAGIQIEKAYGKLKKRYLIVSIVGMCLVLFFFKYLQFFILNLNGLFSFLDVNITVKSKEFPLPIGLSFHTFQSLSYVIEVYKGRQKAEKNLGKYALFVMFFPQLVTGPIERPQNLLSQLDVVKKIRYENLSQGFRLILFGLFTKIVVADNLGLYVDAVYSSYPSLSSISLFLAVFFYSFQIYGDFLGYSLIAVGSALVLDFKLIDNFNSPYFSKTIQEFWKKWHISLSTWFKDYVYIPLGGKHQQRHNYYLTILVVFLLSGFWHGANWTFILWGFFHGFFLILFQIKLFPINYNSVFKNVLQTLFTFVLVSMLWVIFRSTSVTEACQFYKTLFSFQSGKIISIEYPIIIMLSLFIFLDYILQNNRVDIWLKTKSFYFRWFFYLSIITSILFLGAINHFQFIYFQF